MTPKERGQAAAELLRNPLAQELLTTLEQEIIRAWRTAQANTAREDAWYTLKGLERFMVMLTAEVDSAKYDAALEEEDER